MQRIGKAIFDRPRPFLPMRRIVDPVRLMRDVGPGSNMGDAGCQGVDIAVGSIKAVNLCRQPIGWDPSFVAQ